MPVEGATAVVLCRPPHDSLPVKLLSTLPATVISLVALGVSFLAYRYNRVKDTRAREQSIEDDFWLRKVISPLSIEPFLKHMQQVATTLPQAASVTSETVHGYWKAQTEKFEELTVAFHALALVDEVLGREVLTAIEPIEEELATYCGTMRQYLEGQLTQPPDRAATVGRLTAHTVEVLKRVKAHQAKVGNAG